MRFSRMRKNSMRAMSSRCDATIILLTRWVAGGFFANEFGFLARTLTCQPRLRVGGRLVGRVATLLAVKVNRRIARVIGWALTTAVLALEAFVTGPRFDQRAVVGEVLRRAQAAAAGLG